MSKEQLIMLLEQKELQIKEQKEEEENQIKKFADLIRKIEESKGFFKFIAWINAVKELVSFVYQIIEQSKTKTNEIFF